MEALWIAQVCNLRPLIGINVTTRVNVTGQRDRISKLLHSCIQTNRHRGDKSEKRELINSNGEWYQDLAKWLNHYLYFFSFLFFLFNKSTDVQEGMTQKRYMGLYK